MPWIIRVDLFYGSAAQKRDRHTQSAWCTCQGYSNYVVEGIYYSHRYSISYRFADSLVFYASMVAAIHVSHHDRSMVFCSHHFRFIMYCMANCWLYGNTGSGCKSCKEFENGIIFS